MDHECLHHHLSHLHSARLDEHQKTEAGNSRKANDQPRRSTGEEAEGGEKVVHSVLSDIARVPGLALSYIHVLPPLRNLQTAASARLQSPLLDTLLLGRLVQFYHLQLFKSAVQEKIHPSILS